MGVDNKVTGKRYEKGDEPESGRCWNEVHMYD